MLIVAVVRGEEKSICVLDNADWLVKARMFFI
jgi:hypothetical protein